MQDVASKPPHKNMDDYNPDHETGWALRALSSTVLYLGVLYCTVCLTDLILSLNLYCHIAQR